MPNKRILDYAWAIPVSFPKPNHPSDMKYLLTLSLGLFTYTACLAQAAGEAHPIDQELDACMSTSDGQSTYGMITCYQQAEEAWDAELNRLYKALMATLEKEDQDRLRAAQRAWIAYRDAEYSFSGEMYYAMEGTMYRIMAAGREMEMVRTRALEFQEYYSWRTEP